MTRPFDDWVSYFYPETYDPETRDGTLRNLYGERDARVLARLEYVDTAARTYELLNGQADVARTYDAAHVRAIHAYLFQDVYAWAGQYRNVNVFKHMSAFADAHTGQIDGYLAHVRTLVTQTQWAALDHPSFVTSSAEVFAYLNLAHPFREGNGRTSKVFMEHVSELSSFGFDFALVSPRDWNMASMLSGPDIGSDVPVPDLLIPVFEQATIARHSPARPSRRS